MSEKALAEGVCVCVYVTEREREREPEAASQGLFTSAGGLSEILLLPCLDFLQLVQCSSHSVRWEGGGLPSAVPSSTSRFGVEVIHFLINAELLCHSERACCRGGK